MKKVVITVVFCLILGAGGYFGYNAYRNTTALKRKQQRTYKIV